MTGAVLILRPQPGADTTAARALDMGMEPLVYPLFSVEPLAWEPPDPTRFDAVMLTSANALRHGGPALERYRHLPAFTVGATTAKTAEASGFHDILAGEGDVQALIDSIYSKNTRNILHLCGADVRPCDPGGLNIYRAPVYRAVEAGDAAGLARVLCSASVALVHSPRAGERLCALTSAEQRHTLALVAISGAAARAAGDGWARVLVAEKPADASMLALAQQICQT
jgi:uroporphyrinogen-III synthase